MLLAMTMQYNGGALYSQTILLTPDNYLTCVGFFGPDISSQTKISLYLTKQISRYLDTLELGVEIIERRLSFWEDEQTQGQVQPEAPQTPLFSALNLPRRLAAPADAHSGMVNTDLRLLLLLVLLLLYHEQKRGGRSTSIYEYPQAHEPSHTPSLLLNLMVLVHAKPGT
jgi:hypothetical protein